MPAHEITHKFLSECRPMPGDAMCARVLETAWSLGRTAGLAELYRWQRQRRAYGFAAAVVLRKEHFVKRLVLLVIAVPVLLFIVQNFQVAEVRFLTWRIALPHALLIILIFASGILTGWLLRAFSAESPARGARE